MDEEKNVISFSSFNKSVGRFRNGCGVFARRADLFLMNMSDNGKHRARDRHLITRNIMAMMLHEKGMSLCVKVIFVLFIG